MTQEQVIKALEMCTAPGRNCNMSCPYYDIDECEICLERDALDILKAQEPMKPTRYQEGRWFKTWRCGACGGTLVFRNGEDKPNYCTDCGRAVKWE